MGTGDCGGKGESGRYSSKTVGKGRKTWGKLRNNA